MNARSVDAIAVEIAPGELIDKITILEIKMERIEDPAKLANVETELRILSATAEGALPPTERLRALKAALQSVNSKLWELEDEIRDLERSGSFGPDFIAAARAIYRTNDERARLKREINVDTGSRIVEEKSYANY